MSQTYPMLEKVIKLSQRHGYLYPMECMLNESALTCYNYGPLGCFLRKNIIDEWWKAVVITQEKVFPIENSLIHTEASQEDTNSSELQLTSSHCSNSNSSTSEKCFIRSHVSKGMLHHYLPTLSLVGQQIPFGLAQHGTCAKLHSSNHRHKSLIGSNEFHEMVLQYFVPPSASMQHMDELQRTRLRWWRQFACHPSNFTAVDLEKGGENSKGPQEIHLQYEFPWGKDTIEVIKNYQEVPLADMQNSSGVNHQGRFGRKLALPHMVESVAVLETGFLAYLLDAYLETNGVANSKKDKQKREIAQLHASLAPYKAAILTSGTLANTEVREVADVVSSELRSAGITLLDLKNNTDTLDTQQRRYDEMGVPFSIYLNDSTLKNGVAQVRNRDSTVKEKISLTMLKEKILRYTVAC